jgi:DNA-binding NarL/FixJ family response regulator
MTAALHSGRLTPAMVDVLAGAARGESVVDTARRRVVSPHTVATQRKLALQVLHARTMPEAVAVAVRRGIV